MSNETSTVPYRQMIEQMADAVVYSDAAGVIVEWNTAAERLFHFSRADAIGRSLDLIIPERLRAAHWAGFHRAVERRATQHSGAATITRALTGDGETIYVDISFALVLDAAGTVIGSLGVARDATLRQQERRELQAFRQQASTDSRQP